MKNKISYLYMLLFLLVTNICLAQQELTSAEAEKETYKLYQDRNWSELIKVGQQAIDSGFDYYFMRMRLGISYYENKNYRLAEVHFKKALTFNSKSDLVHEYLYYCYALTGRKEEARKLTKTFSLNLKSKVQADKFKAIDFVMLEGAKKVVNSDYSKDNSTTYFETANYVQLGLKHHIKNSFSMFYAFTYFGQQTYLGEVDQLQYYFKGAIPLKGNWKLSPAIHLVNVDFKGTDSQYDLKDNYFVGSAALQKSYKRWDIGIGTTFSNIGGSNQYNHFGELSYSVLGNSKFVLGLTGYIHKDDSVNEYNTSWLPFVYVQASKKISLKVNYLHNQGENIIEQNGYLVNNSIDLTESRTSVFVDYNIGKATLYGSYQLENKQDVTSNFKYKYNLFLLGLRLGF